MYSYSISFADVAAFKCLVIWSLSMHAVRQYPVFTFSYLFMHSVIVTFREDSSIHLATKDTDLPLQCFLDGVLKYQYANR